MLHRHVIDYPHPLACFFHQTGPDEIAAPPHVSALVKGKKGGEYISAHGEEGADLNETGSPGGQSVELGGEAVVYVAVGGSRRLGEGEIVAENQVESTDTPSEGLGSDTGPFNTIPEAIAAIGRGEIVVVVGVVVMILRCWRKVEQGTALIIEGKKGPTVHFSRAIVLPLIHQAEIMDISIKRSESCRQGEEGLSCKDNVRADIKVAC